MMSGVSLPPSPSCTALVPTEEEHQQPPHPSPQQQGLSSPTQLFLLPQQQGQGHGALVYPLALAQHDAVVADRDLFYDTLNKFHASLGTRLMIPTIGGKELDLHLLYVEVSARGGLEQVIKDRKWKDVTVVFNFPPTTTSASFVLRKYYISLLHHYEQVYFFGTQVAASLPGQSLGQPSVDNEFANHGAEDGELVLKKRRRRGALDPARLHEADLVSPVGHTVSGVIDGKFEHGYLVTVVMGTEKLRGILYQMPSGSLTPQFATVSIPEVRRKQRRRRKDEMPKKDPNAPKPNRSGYNFFFQEQHMRLKVLHPDKDKEISRMIGELWNKQTEEERAIYQERGVKDKERYKREMEEYQEGIKSQACCDGSGGGYCGGSRGGREDVVPPVLDTVGRPDNSISSLSESESYLMVEEEKLKCDVVDEKEPVLYFKVEEQVASHDQVANDKSFSGLEFNFCRPLMSSSSSLLRHFSPLHDFPLNIGIEGLRTLSFPDGCLCASICNLQR